MEYVYIHLILAVINTIVAGVLAAVTETYKHEALPLIIVYGILLAPVVTTILIMFLIYQLGKYIGGKFL